MKKKNQPVHWLDTGKSMVALGLCLKSLFLVCFLMTVILYPSWSHQGWWNDILSLMPNLLGFSLGGFAMWIAIGDEAFKNNNW